MKRPEYVAASVTSAKKALSGESYSKETLQSVFSRSGFTDGYLKGKINADMFGYRKKDDVTAATPVLKQLEALYKDEAARFPLKCELTLKKDEPALLKVSSRGFSAFSSGDTPQTPQKSPLTKELAEKSLRKLGGTPYYFESLEFLNPHSLTLPLSAVNALRRDAVTSLTSRVTELHREVIKVVPEEISAHVPTFHKMRARFNSFSQYSEAFDKCEYVSFPIDEIIKSPESLKKIKARVIAELPELLYTLEEECLNAKLNTLKALGVTDVAVGNIGTLKLSRDKGFTLHGTNLLNITNTDSLSEYSALGLNSATVSFEMNKDAISALGGNIERGYISYGYLPLMHFRACPQKGKGGCGACTGVSAITDRKGISFTLLCHSKKYSVLLNSVPLYVGDKERFNTDFEVLYFTVEGADECKSILNAALKKAPLKGAKTSGIYFRELL